MNGADLSPNGGNSPANLTAFKDLLFLNNPIYPSDPMNSNISTSTAFFANRIGNTYDVTYGSFYSEIINLNFNIGGSGTLQNPITGLVSAMVYQGKVANGGGLTYSALGSLVLGGPPSYMSQQLSSLPNVEKVVIGGNSIVGKIANWVSGFPSNGTYTYGLKVSSSLKMTQTSVAFVPDYKYYITSGILVSILPLGILGIAFLSENRKWRRKSEVVIAGAWTLIYGLLISGVIFLYYLSVW
ncbi:MAG: hypothetical protein ACYDAZ_08610 [Thermoplasmataceae archaeon]